MSGCIEKSPKECNEGSDSVDGRGNKYHHLNVTKIQATSLLVSYWRFKESQKPGGLISDLPDGLILDALLSPEQRQIFENSPILNKGVDALALRTRFIDDWLLLQDDDQETSDFNAVVNLGAGMDARPYRLKGLAKRSTYIEIDSDVSLLELKHSILQKGSASKSFVSDATITSGITLNPFCPIARVSADLSDVKSTFQSLQEAGLRLSSGGADDEIQSVDWIAEGLFAYLDPSQHKPLLKLAHDASGSRSRMVLTVLDPTGMDNFYSMGFQIPWKQLVPVQAIVQQAKEVGWHQAAVIPFEQLFQRYHRLPVTDLTGYVLLTLAKQ